MFLSVNFQKSLRLPESTICTDINIFLNKLHIIQILKPIDFFTTANKSLLEEYDECDVTRGEISFIPLDFLRSYLKEHNYYNKKNDEVLIEYNNIKNTKKHDFHLFYKNVNDLSENELKLCIEKSLIIKYLLNKKVFSEHFFKNNTYKNIKLSFYRKPFLFSTLTKSVDACKLIDEKNVNMFEDPNYIKKKVKLVKLDDVIKYNTDEWMYVKDIEQLINRYYYALNQETRAKTYFAPTFVLNNINNDINYCYNNISSRYDISEFKNYRYIVFFILYKSHFTAVIIDREVIIDDKKKSIAFFYNSCGYEPQDFHYNKDYWFIDSGGKISNHKIYKNCINEYLDNNTAIEAFCVFLKYKINITNFVFNTSSIQNFSSECGIFSSVFIYLFLNYIRIKEFEILITKYIYFNMEILGNDMIYGMYRGLFFVTNEDDIKDYQANPYVYSIKNHKFLDYVNIYYNSLKKIEKINLDIKAEVEVYNKRFVSILK